MAVTKIIKIKSSPKACIKYAINEDKTEEGTLVSYFQCQKDTADYIFKLANSMNGRKADDEGTVKAYHFIQSFAKTDTVSPEEANRIGMELMEKMFGGSYTFLCATHVDRDHIHNHIVMCAAKRDMSGRKLNDNLALLHKLRQTSDDICRQHGLSVIDKKKGKGKDYKEWLTDLENPNASKKQQLRVLIDSKIKVANDFDDFIEKMKEAGAGIDFGNSKKYGRVTKYRLPDASEKDRWHRGYSLEQGYSDEIIKKRIANRIRNEEVREAKRLERAEKRKAEKAAMSKAEKAIDRTKLKITKMIDTSDMSTDNYALIRWRNKQNALLAEKMKETLRDKYGTDYTKIRSKINSLEAENNRKAASIKKNKGAITNIRTLIENCQIYMDTFKTNDRFEKSTDQERYYQRHDTELNAYSSASAYLDSTIAVKSILRDPERNKGYMDKLKQELAKLEEITDIYEQDIKKNEKDLIELKNIEKELDKFHNRNREEL